MSDVDIEDWISCLRDLSEMLYALLFLREGIAYVLLWEGVHDGSARANQLYETRQTSYMI